MRRISFFVCVALVFPALAAGASRDVKLSLVAYSTPREAYGATIPHLASCGPIRSTISDRGRTYADLARISAGPA